MKIDNFFSDIYCINLDERKDRWVDVVEDLKTLQLTQVKRYPAIKHSRGAIGCRMSHVDIITQAKNNGSDSVLILEDDIKVLPGGSDHISKALEELSTIDWEIFYFGATIAPGATVIPVTEHVAKTNFAYTTHAYALNSKVFDHVLEEVKKYNVIDVFYNEQVVSRGKAFIINPIRIVQKESYSDIEGKNTDYAKDMLDFFERALKRGAKQSAMFK
jgi:GR25 family glycosyltransferase involved in LPS biosynthesis